MSDTPKRYRVIHAYESYWYGKPMLIPAGSIGTWFENGNCYTFEPAIDGYVPCVSKWAVEAWFEYFEEVAE